MPLGSPDRIKQSSLNPFPRKAITQIHLFVILAGTALDMDTNRASVKGVEMLHLIVNPLAKSGRNFELVRRERSRVGEVCWCPFPFEKHLADCCRRSDSDATDRIVLIGGDGTVNRAINALGPDTPPIALIPAGTANDLARSLGIPEELEGAIELACSGCVQRIDLISVNDRLFATCGGIGLPAGAARLANDWRTRGRIGSRLAQRLGSAVYMLAAIAELASSRALDVEIECGGATCREQVLAMFVANQSRIGRRYIVSPAASHHDGLLDLCSIPATRDGSGRLALLRESARGRIDALPHVRHQQSSSVTIRIEKVVSFYGDGEILCESDTFRVRTLPSALRVVTPFSEEALRVAA